LTSQTDPLPVSQNSLQKEADALLVTVITPTYNQGQYIATCIESVLSQTHRRIEYLIYDACSPDGTNEIVARYLSDTRLTYYRELDSGQANALNKGFDRAKGEIVCWLNSDDFFFSRHVLDQVCRAFIMHQEIDVITGDGYLAATNGDLLAPLVVSKPASISARGVAIASYFMQPATFWRRNELRLDESLHYTFDWKLFVSMYRTHRSVLYLREYLAVYRPHEAAKTTQDTASRKREICHVLTFAGATRLQVGWAWLIFVLYSLSETLHLPVVKSFARFANRVMKKLSVDRIFS
jgi:glycosyltransferase involved in cell wall biosynthesis